MCCWCGIKNENNNRLIRRHIPKGEDFDEKQNRDIEYIENWLRKNCNSSANHLLVRLKRTRSVGRLPYEDSDRKLQFSIP